MNFELEPLPYDFQALEPHISARTLEFHYTRHHQTYMNKLKGLLEDDPRADKTLEEIILQNTGDVFNNAAQVWNHAFYWNSMRPDGGGRPDDDIASALASHFGSVDAFTDRFADAASTAFGSGWVWLVSTPERKLDIMVGSNADTPMCYGSTALLTIDVWEHAYYLDYQNKRPDYVDAFLEHLINWEFVGRNLRQTM